MAVRQRFLNSTVPFICSSKAELKGSYPSLSTTEQDGYDPCKDKKMGYMCDENWETNDKLIAKVMAHGTAAQMEANETPCKASFIAQAECETVDSQEFSPSCSAPCYVRSSKPYTYGPPLERNNVACSTTASVQEPCDLSAPLTPKKKSRRRQKRKVKKKHEKRSPRHRTPSGVPEQESGGSLVLIPEESSIRGSELSTSCCSSIESSVDQGQGTCFYDIYHTGSSCSPLNWPDQILHPLPSYEQDSSSDSLSSLGDCSLALAGLRGCVSQGDRCFAWPFFQAVERDARVDEDEFFAADSVNNEGLIFDNKNINPVDSEYKEGSEFVLSHFIKEGSYGEVYSAQDVNTGFTFAVKKVPMKRFNSEEVGAWSALRSPCVVELFGVVREGPYVFFLMDHKSGSLGDLIVERGRLPEDLSLHYHSQVLTGLEYLVKKKVVHLDIKADNVLLSEDGRNTFLCDFGHAERLDNQGQSLSGSKDLKGTETHMAPEIVKGDPRGAKADVWSICCMLLHMLNGCQPWTRYYTCRLYLKIANDPPPLREIPHDCSPFTAEVLKVGLQKDPVKRSSASDLKEKTERALREVGGLTSPIKGPYTEPLYVANKPPDSLQLFSGSTDCDVHVHMGLKSTDKVITAGMKAWKLNDEKGVEADCKETKRGSPTGPQMLISEPNHKRSNKLTTVPELELRKLENDFYLSSLSQLHSAEMQEHLLSCLNSDSAWEAWDKRDSGRWSLNPGDNCSSGVYSCNSQPDVPVFSMDLRGHTQFPPPCCFEGVDVCIQDFSSRSIRIRETRRVKVGHIATGISDQISERVFTLETTQGLQVAHDDEVQESGLELCCVPAPDFSSAWVWRVRDGVLETK